MKAITLCNAKTIEARTTHGPSAEMKRAVIKESPSTSQEPIRRIEADNNEFVVGQ